MAEKRKPHRLRNIIIFLLGIGGLCCGILTVSAILTPRAEPPPQATSAESDNLLATQEPTTTPTEPPAPTPTSPLTETLPAPTETPSPTSIPPTSTPAPTESQWDRRSGYLWWTEDATVVILVISEIHQNSYASVEQANLWISRGEACVAKPGTSYAQDTGESGFATMFVEILSGECFGFRGWVPWEVLQEHPPQS